MKAKKILLILLALTLIFTAVSCGGGGSDDPCTTCIDGNGDGKCDKCQKDMPNEEVMDVVLFEDEEATFQIVVSKDLPSSIRQTVNTKIKTMLKNEYGITVDVILEGSPSDTEMETEILIGEVTSRGEKYAFDGHTLGSQGYGYKIVGSKVLINAGSNEVFSDVIDSFVENILTDIDPFYHAMTKDDVDVYIQDDYYITSLAVNGTDMKGYTIAADITRDYYQDVANYFQTQIYERTGYYFKIVDVEDATDKSVVIKHNKSLSDSESFKVSCVGSQLVIECAFDNMLSDSVIEFASEVIYGEEGAVNLSGKLYASDISVLYYEDHGAKGDGVTDDFKAIYDTHVLANISGQSVKAKPDSVFYIFETRFFEGTKTQVLSIPIKTNTDWQGAKFIIDDTNVPAFGGHENSNLYGANIFTILPNDEHKKVTITNTATLSAIVADGLDPNTEKINFKLDGWDGALMLIPYNESHLVFRRRGYGQHSGEAMHELIVIDENGVVDQEETPIMFQYTNISSMEVFRLDPDSAITVKNATIETRQSKVNHMRESDGVVSYYTSYSKRGIGVNRSFTTVENINHVLSGGFTLLERANGFEGPANNGMFTATDANHVTFKNCTIPGRQMYGSHSSYNLKVNEVNKIVLDGCIQSNFWVEVDFDTGIMTGHTEYEDGYYPSMSAVTMRNDEGSAVSVGMHWGIGGTNYCKNMEYLNSMISRYDAHAGLYHGKIINTSINGMELTGVGNLVIDNIKWYSYSAETPFLYLRADYGYTWDGLISVKDSSAYMFDITSNPATLYLAHHNYNNWYYGYTCAFPNLIFDNFDVYSLKNQAPVEAGYPIYLTKGSSVMTQMHVPGVITTPITLDYRDADGDGFIDEPLFDINMDGTIDEKDVVDLDGNGKVGNTDLAYDDFKDDPEKTQWKGYNHPNCTVNVNVTKPPQYIKVINNDGVNGSGGYVYYIRNTATTGYSDGGWNREPGAQDTFGGFFGNTKFYYGTGENDYFHGSNFPSQNKTTTFKFY